MMAPTSLKAGFLLLSQLQLTWAMTRQLVSCSMFTAAIAGDTCDSFTTREGLNKERFLTLNPSITCSNLVAGQDYCVFGSFSSAPTPTYSTLTASASVLTTSSLASGMPQQTGTAAQCNNFYLVQPDEQCDVIETRFGLSHNDFISWNPTVNKDCTSMIAGYYYCVSVPGSDKFSTSSIPTSAQATPTSGFITSTTSAQTTPTSGITTLTNDITTPKPIQTGMAAGCTKFHFVQSDDSCFDIAKEFNVPLAAFYSWNPAVGSSCMTLNVGYYVCVDAAGSTPPAAAPTGTTASSAGNGMPTPTPFQPGMVTNCKKFYLVKSGDTCAFIAENQGTTVDDIKKWNPQVGSGCTALWLNNNICVGV